MATREEICAVCDEYVALLGKGDAEGAATISMTAIDVMSVDDAGKITALRAYADPDAPPGS